MTTTPQDPPADYPDVELEAVDPETPLEHVEEDGEVSPDEAAAGHRAWQAVDDTDDQSNGVDQ